MNDSPFERTHSGPIYLVGGGGHGRVVLDAALTAGLGVAAIVDPGLPIGSTLFGISIIGGDEALDTVSPGAAWLNGFGANPAIARRRSLFDRLSKRHEPIAVCHPSATISPHAHFGRGSQIMAGVVVQAGCEIAENCVVNTGARIDHDCSIADHCFIAPGAVLCGEVSIGVASFVGAGAIILPGLTIGAGVIVGAGAVVISNLLDGEKVIGNPARRGRSYG